MNQQARARTPQTVNSAAIVQELRVGGVGA